MDKSKIENPSFGQPSNERSTYDLPITLNESEQKGHETALAVLPSKDNVLAAACRRILHQHDSFRDGKPVSKDDIDALSRKLVQAGCLPMTSFEVLRRRYAEEVTNEAAEFLRQHGVMATQSDDTFARYTAYSARATKLVRYLAYTSDFGEAFRPVAHPYLVTASYAVSIGYVVGDVAYECYADYHHGVRDSHLYHNTAKRAVFQGIASLAIPAFVIHTAVIQSKKHFWKTFSNARLKTLGPTATGLALIPFLPLADEPVEHVVDSFFNRLWPQKEN